MFSSNQTTIANSISCFGIGVHSGKNVNLTLHSAEANTGIIFRKIDSEGNYIADIKADYSLVSNTMLSTSLTNKEGHTISTVEHLMAALWGCGIDNLIAEVDSDELPIMDGSAEHFCFMLDSAGIKELKAGRKIIEVIDEVTVEENGAIASIGPNDGFSVSVAIDYENKLIAYQERSFNYCNSCFKMDLSRARTFGLMSDEQKLRAAGLAKGASLDNVVVIDDSKVLNKEGLRYEDEFVRHKMLDSIGDLFLSGGFMKCNFKGYKSGHSLNNKLLRKLFATQSAYRYVTTIVETENKIVA